MHSDSLSVQSPAEKALAWLDRAVEGLIALVVFLMVAVGGWQVFCRYVLNESLSWSEEFQRFAHIWVVFLAVPVGCRRGAHIGMEVLAGKLPAGARRVLALATDLLWLAMGVAIAFYTLRLMEVAGTQTSSGLRIRMDWVYAGMLVGSVYLVIVAVRLFIGHVREPLRGPDEEEAAC